MHSNNDGMDPNWKPTTPSKFIQYMNEKKIEFNRSHRETFNTVHVTNWSEEYVARLMRVIEVQQTLLKRIDIDTRNIFWNEAYNVRTEVDALLNGEKE